MRICDFCGRNEHQVALLLPSPNQQAHICNQCVSAINGAAEAILTRQVETAKAKEAALAAKTEKAPEAKQGVLPGFKPDKDAPAKEPEQLDMFKGKAANG